MAPSTLADEKAVSAKPARKTEGAAAQVLKPMLGNRGMAWFYGRWLSPNLNFWNRTFTPDGLIEYDAGKDAPPEEYRVILEKPQYVLILVRSWNVFVERFVHDFYALYPTQNSRATEEGGYSMRMASCNASPVLADDGSERPFTDADWSRGISELRRMWRDHPRCNVWPETPGTIEPDASWPFRGAWSHYAPYTRDTYPPAVIERQMYEERRRRERAN